MPQKKKATTKIFAVTYTECTMGCQTYKRVGCHFGANCTFNNNKAEPNERVGEENKEKIIHRTRREQKNIFTIVKFTRRRTF